MKSHILFVDDEPGVLEGIEMMLFKQRKRWQMQFALNAQEGLELMAKKPFDVVMSDMRMPGMDGIQFLTRVKEAAPDTVRMMLTGNADLDTAIAAVNAGNVFRFLTKPCEPETMVGTLEAGIEQHRLITAEKELLTKTLSGSIKLLTEVLSMTDPKGFGQALWLRDSVKSAAQELKVRNAWEMMLAALLAQIGYITLPPEIATRVHEGRELAESEADMVARVPQIGHDLLSKIPRLETVAQIVLYQNKHFDGSGFPRDQVMGEDIPVGARLIKILVDLNQLSAVEGSRYKVLRIMKERRGWYDPQLLEQVSPLFVSPHAEAEAAETKSESIDWTDLRLGHKLLSNVETVDGHIIAAAGNRISPTFLEKIKNYADISGIREPILVASGPVVDD